MTPEKQLIAFECPTSFSPEYVRWVLRKFSRDAGNPMRIDVEYAQPDEVWIDRSTSLVPNARIVGIRFRPLEDR
jgi:hypothetical protein